MNTNTYVRNLRTGKTTQFFGWKASVVGAIIMVATPLIFIASIAFLLVILASPILLIAGLINMCIVGLNIGNVLLVLLGILGIAAFKKKRSQ
jgi:hypothetical protein